MLLLKIFYGQIKFNIERERVSYVFRKAIVVLEI